MQTLTLIWALSLALTQPPRDSSAPGPGLAADRDGRLVFVDAARDRVWRMSRDGRLSRLAAGKHLPLIIPADDGSVWVLARHDPIELRWLFSRIAPDGSVSDVVRQSPIPNANGALTMDARGVVYFLNLSELLELGLDSQVTVFARPVLLQGARTAVFGPAGALIVIDSNSVRAVRRGSPDVIDLAGSYEAGLVDQPGAGARFDYPVGLAVDSAGGVFVADYGNAALRRIAPDGAVSTVARSPGGWRPTGVALAEGTVYVLEQSDAATRAPDALAGLVADVVGSPRVRRLAPDGSLQTAATVRRWWALVALAAAPAVAALGAMVLRPRRRVTG